MGHWITRRHQSLPFPLLIMATLLLSSSLSPSYWSTSPSRNSLPPPFFSPHQPQIPLLALRFKPTCSVLYSQNRDTLSPLIGPFSLSLAPRHRRLPQPITCPRSPLPATRPLTDTRPSPTHPPTERLPLYFLPRVSFLSPLLPTIGSMLV